MVQPVAVDVSKAKEPPSILERIGVDRTCKLAGQFNGCVTLTYTDDGTHTLWLYTHPIASGDRTTMRNRYADHMRGDILEKYYRSA